MELKEVRTAEELREDVGDIVLVAHPEYPGYHQRQQSRNIVANGVEFDSNVLDL